MRHLGDFSDAYAAERLVSYLNGEGLGAEVREAEGDIHRVWVHDEDHMPEAEKALETYLRNPDHPKFAKARGPVHRSDRTPDYSKKLNRHRVVDVRTEVFGARTEARVTLALVVISVVLTFLSWGEQFRPFALKLYYSEYIARDFREILAGQVWRLVTPIFLHGDFLHLFFNMLWLWQLGGQIESVERSRTLLVLVLVTAVLCNTGQYLVSGPAFLGMSGVVYALLGYIWMMSRHKPMSGYVMQQQLVVFMVIWLFLCLFGIIPGAANTEHVVGILAGMAWGWLKAGGPRAKNRQKEWQKKMKRE